MPRLSWLFNEENCKGLGHNILEAVARIDSVKDLAFTLPDDIRCFIKEINRQGRDRYLCEDQRVLFESLDALDRAIWYIRGYCWHMRQGPFIGNDGAQQDWFDINRRGVSDSRLEADPRNYHIHAGYLEGLIERRDSEAYRMLARQNKYFGHEKDFGARKIVRSSFALPIYDASLHPEAYDEIE